VSTKAVIPRATGERDIAAAVDFYLGEGAEPAALGFVDALEQAFLQIGRRPAIGSPRYGHELGIAGLRHWPIRRYSHLVFYIERDDHVDVWRILHGVRDIPTGMRVPE